MTRRADADRGQLVLVAAAVVALALVSMGFAYAQLGHDPDSTADPTVDAGTLRGVVDAGADAAAANVSGRVGWDARSAGVESANVTFRDRVDGATAAYRDRGALVTVGWNDTAADRWAGDDCPSGEMRRFGPCEGRRGFVVQERAGDLHVLGVAVDVRVESESEAATYAFEVTTP